MSPLGHLGLAVVLVECLEYDTRTAAVLVVGAALPDLIDKPVAEVGLVAAYHTVGHSLFVAAGVVGAAVVLRRHGRRRAVPLAVGWRSRLACDLYVAVPNYLADYLRPIRSAEPTGQYAARYVTTHRFATELLLAAVAVVLVVRSRPGTASLRSDAG